MNITVECKLVCPVRRREIRRHRGHTFAQYIKTFPLDFPKCRRYIGDVTKLLIPVSSCNGNDIYKNQDESPSIDRASGFNGDRDDDSAVQIKRAISLFLAT